MYVKCIKLLTWHSWVSGLTSFMAIELTRVLRYNHNAQHITELTRVLWYNYNAAHCYEYADSFLNQSSNFCNCMRIPCHRFSVLVDIIVEI